MIINTTLKLTVMAFAAYLTIPAAQAQIEPRAVIDIPFAYSVAGRAMPAGTYSVFKNTQSGVLTLRKTDSQAVAMVLGTPIGGRDFSEVTKLSFHKYGDAYFLHQAWLQGSAVGLELRPSREEKELVARARQAIILSAKR